YRRNGRSSSVAANASPSRTRRITWSTSSPFAFGHRQANASEGSVPHPAQISRLPTSGRHAGLGVELLDHGVPHGDDVLELAPPGRVPAGRELLDRHALLLHPREVAQVEDPL